MLNLLYAFVGVVIFGFIYLVVAVNAIVALVFAFLLGFVSYTLWKWIYDQQENPYNAVVPIAMAVVAVLMGALLKQASRGSGISDWVIAPVLAGGTVWFVYWMRSRSRTLFCASCHQPIQGAGSVTCPRCKRVVCTRPGCWEHSLHRCVSCHERGVIRFPLSEEWWSTRLGSRVRNGQCFDCLQEANEADLRECGQCHYPMCKRCWDYHNGVCQRCQWTIPQIEERRYRRRGY